MDESVNLDSIKEQIGALEFTWNFQCIFLGLDCRGEKFVFASKVGKDYFEKHKTLLDIFYEFCYDNLVKDVKNLCDVQSSLGNSYTIEPVLNLEASCHGTIEHMYKNIGIQEIVDSPKQCLSMSKEDSVNYEYDQSDDISANKNIFWENDKSNISLDDNFTEGKCTNSEMKTKFKHRKKLKFIQFKNKLKKLHQDSLHLCKWCDATFQTQEQKHEHTSRHLLDGFHCKKCDAKFKTWATLKNHTSSVHAISNLFQCQSCKHTFKTSLLLHRHISKVHQMEQDDQIVNSNSLDNKPNSNFVLCSFCGRSFEKEKELQRHVGYMHRRHRLMVCNYCEKGFKNRSSLDKHITNVHLNNEVKLEPVILNNHNSDMDNNNNDFRHNNNNNDFHQSINHSTFTDGFNLREHLQANECNGSKFDLFQSDMTCKNELSNVLLDDSELNLLDDFTHKDIVTSLLDDDDDNDGEEDMTRVTEERLKQRSMTNVWRKKRASKCNLCHVCGKNFSQPHYLQQHLVCHRERRPYRCTDCGKQFKRRSTLREHEAIHMDRKLYRCQTCSREFKFASVLRQHKFIHTRDRPHSCELCKKSFKQLTGLRKHNCAMSGNVKLNLERGLLHKDDNTPAIEITPEQQPKRTINEIDISKPFACSLCPKRFNLQKALKKHNRVHSDLRPYVCEVCNKCFKHPSSLRQHGSVHSEDRPYKCKCCDKRFKSATSLNEHMDKNKYKCTGCGKEYMHRKSLKVHMNVCPLLPQVQQQQQSLQQQQLLQQLQQEHQQHYLDSDHANEQQQQNDILLQLTDAHKNLQIDPNIYSTLIICQQQPQQQQQQIQQQDQQFTTITIPSAIFIQNPKQPDNHLPFDVSFSTITNQATNNMDQNVSDTILQLGDGTQPHWLLNSNKSLSHLQLQDQQLQQLLQQPFM